MLAASSSTTSSGGSSGPPAGARPGEGGLEHLLDQGGEQPPQPALVVGRGAQVQGVGAGRAGPRARSASGAGAGAPGAGAATGSANGSSTVSAVRVHRAALAVVAQPRRPGGLEGLGTPGRLEERRPPRPSPGCRPSARRRPWSGPPVAAAKSSGASSLAAVAYQNSPSAVVAGAAGHLGEVGGHPAGPGPGARPPERRPRVAASPVAPAGSKHHTRPGRGARPGCRARGRS